MARKTEKTSSQKKEAGRMKQMWQVFQMTRRYDKNIVPFLLLAFLSPIAVGLILAILLSDGNGLTLALWVIASALIGLLLALIILGKRAEKAAYSQIQGQPGAVGAVLRSSLRRNWRGSEMPVAVNAKTHDAIYRAVGRGGIVLISEGPQSRTTRMLEEERRKISRILPNVPVTFIRVGEEEGCTQLHKIPARLAKIKSQLTKPEVRAISNRLTSLGNASIPIPKGVDPLKVRAQRGR